MANVKINNNQGFLVAKGTGTNLDSNPITITGHSTVTASGIECIKLSANTTLTAAGNTDINVALPAGALVTDLGLVCSEAVDSGGAHTVTVTAGTTGAAGNDLIAATQVNETNTAIAVNTGISVMSGNIFHTNGAALGAFEDAAPLHFTSAQTIHCRIASAGAALTSGKMHMYVKYVVVN